MWWGGGRPYSILVLAAAHPMHPFANALLLPMLVPTAGAVPPEFRQLPLLSADGGAGAAVMSTAAAGASGDLATPRMLHLGDNQLR